MRSRSDSDDDDGGGAVRDNCDGDRRCGCRCYLNVAGAASARGCGFGGANENENGSASAAFRFGKWREKKNRNGCESGSDYEGGGTAAAASPAAFGPSRNRLRPGCCSGAPSSWHPKEVGLFHAVHRAEAPVPSSTDLEGDKAGEDKRRNHHAAAQAPYDYYYIPIGLLHGLAADSEVASVPCTDGKKNDYGGCCCRLGFGSCWIHHRGGGDYCCGCGDDCDASDAFGDDRRHCHRYYYYYYCFHCLRRDGGDDDDYYSGGDASSFSFRFRPQRRPLPLPPFSHVLLLPSASCC